MFGEPLKIIFKESISTGLVPSSWKCVDGDNPLNCRPELFTGTVCEVFKKKNSENYKPIRASRLQIICE